MKRRLELCLLILFEFICDLLLQHDVLQLHLSYVADRNRFGLAKDAKVFDEPEALVFFWFLVQRLFYLFIVDRKVAFIWWVICCRYFVSKFYFSLLRRRCGDRTLVVKVLSRFGVVFLSCGQIRLENFLRFQCLHNMHTFFFGLKFQNEFHRL